MRRGAPKGKTKATRTTQPRGDSNARLEQAAHAEAQSKATTPLKPGATGAVYDIPVSPESDSGDSSYVEDDEDESSSSD